MYFSLTKVKLFHGEKWEKMPAEWTVRWDGTAGISTAHIKWLGALWGWAINILKLSGFNGKVATSSTEYHSEIYTQKNE